MTQTIQGSSLRRLQDFNQAVHGMLSTPARCVYGAYNKLDARLEQHHHRAGDQAMASGVGSYVATASTWRGARQGANAGRWADVTGLLLVPPVLAASGVRALACAGASALGAQIAGDRGRAWGQALADLCTLSLRGMQCLYNAAEATLGLVGAAVGAGIGVVVGALRGIHLRRVADKAFAQLPATTFQDFVDLTDAYVVCAKFIEDAEAEEAKDSPFERTQKICGECAEWDREFQTFAAVYARHTPEQWRDLRGEWMRIRRRHPGLAPVLGVIPQEFVENFAKTLAQAEDILADRYDAARALYLKEIKAA